MIPSIIHFCWFGKGEKSQLEKKCIESWKKILPNYQIIEWNEDNFDIHCNRYVEQAYQCKKYAFVSDYVRLYVLYHYGGIYLDTDVEIKKTLDKYLEWNEVFGFETFERIGTAVMFTKQHSSIIKTWMNTYHSREFVKNGKMDMTPNVKELTTILKNSKIVINGKRQCFTDKKLLVCEKDIFFPYAIGESTKQEFLMSDAVHWCEESWVSGKTFFKHQFVKGIKKLIGSKKYYNLKKILKIGLKGFSLVGEKKVP